MRSSRNACVSSLPFVDVRSRACLQAHGRRKQRSSSCGSAPVEPRKKIETNQSTARGALSRSSGVASRVHSHSSTPSHPSVPQARMRVRGSQHKTTAPFGGALFTARALRRDVARFRSRCSMLTKRSQLRTRSVPFSAATVVVYIHVLMMICAPTRSRRPRALLCAIESRQPVPSVLWRKTKKHFTLVVLRLGGPAH